MTDPNRRLIQFLGMLGSAHDGEVLNAARMAQRLITELGLTWEEALARGLSEENMLQAVQQAHRDGYLEGFEQGQQSKARRKTWVGLAKQMLEDDDELLTPWEQEFCESFLERGWGTPSPKQRAVFERIADKCGMDCPE